MIEFLKGFIAFLYYWNYPDTWEFWVIDGVWMVIVVLITSVVYSSRP